MQHNSDGRLVILETIKYDKDGKDYIDWLEKTDLVNISCYLLEFLYDSKGPWNLHEWQTNLDNLRIL